MIAIERRHAAAFALALAGVMTVLVPLLDRSPASAQVFANSAFVVVGALITVRRPENGTGPLLIAFGLSFDTLVTVGAVGDRVFGADPDRLAWFHVIGEAMFPIAAWFLIPLLLLFPHGRIRSSAERRYIVITLVGHVAMTVVGVLATPSTLVNDELELAHPFLSESVAANMRTLFGVLMGGHVLTTLAAALSNIRTWRRGNAIERRQIGWLAFGATAYILIAATNVIMRPGNYSAEMFLFIDAVGVVLIPIAVGLAIMRYGLYEIDRIVKKSVVYLGLAASATLAYVGIVVVPLLVLGQADGDEGPGLVLPIIATGVVALLFEPLRRWLVARANRLVYGDRSSPHEVLSALTDRLADSDIGSSLDQLARLLGAGTGARVATIWRAGHDNRVATVDGHWSADGPGPAHPDPDSADDTVASAPVRHGGEQLGVVVIRKAPDDPISPNDLELLADVAGGVGLLMRNVGLNRELERRAADVRASRRRLIEVQDAERRRLERDLHDGAQQEIVALKVKLGLAQTIACREGADELGAKIEKLAAATQDAVDAMRAVAHGIYPPLLEAEGLAPALASLARSAKLELTVDVDLDGRPPRTVEQTVYFCVLETLHRANDAGASTMRVTITAAAGEMMLAIEHDGPALDLTPLTDRVDAASGTIEASSPTTVICRLPLADLAEPAEPFENPATVDAVVHA